MTTDLWILVLLAIWGVCLPVVYFVGRGLVPGGFRWAASNRYQPLQVPHWVTRAERAHHNFLESFPLIAALIVVAHVSGHNNDMTALGCQLYLGARVIHAISYITGVAPLRSAISFVSMGAIILVAVQFF